MNPLFLVTLLAAGAAANAYGSQPAVVRVEQGSYAAPAVRLQPQPLAYAQPARQASYDSYSSSSLPARHVPILRFNQEIRGGHSDNVEYETPAIKSVFNTQVVRGRGGSFMDENGRMVQSDASVEQSGHSYHETPEGQHISLTWTADEQGFKPTGSHLPQPVELPAEHAAAHREALAIAAANPPRPEDNGYDSYSAPALVRVQPYNAPSIRHGRY